MSPSHKLKRGKRYRYYVSNEAGSEQAAPTMRLPARPLEASVIAALLRASGDTSVLIAEASVISAIEISRLRSGQKRFAERVQQARTFTLRPILLSLDLRIVIEDDRISASLCKERFRKLINPQADWSSVSARMTFPVPASLQRRGQKHKLRVDPVGGHDRARQPSTGTRPGGPHRLSCPRHCRRHRRGTPTGRPAITKARTQRPPTLLENFARDGRVKLKSNHSERLARPCGGLGHAVARKITIRDSGQSTCQIVSACPVSGHGPENAACKAAEVRREIGQPAGTAVFLRT